MRCGRPVTNFGSRLRAFRVQFALVAGRSIVRKFVENSNCEAPPFAWKAFPAVAVVKRPSKVLPDWFLEEGWS